MTLEDLDKLAHRRDINRVLIDIRNDGREVRSTVDVISIGADGHAYGPDLDTAMADAIREAEIGEET
jgi:hypothetical protein